MHSKFHLSPTKKTDGFAMLFTVLMVSLILTLALGISDVTYKQGVLSSLAKDSQIAFYQADAGMECALYYDLNVNKQSFNGINTIPPQLRCGTATLNYDSSASDTDYYVYAKSTSGAAPCIASVTIDKRSIPIEIESRGNNICQTSQRQVERAIQVTY